MDREQLLQSWLAWEEGRPQIERRLIKRTFASLRKGLPVTVGELASELGIPLTSLRDYMEQLAGYGRITLENEVVTGAAGLSVAPTSHRLLLDGQPLYTWCALDAIGIPAALAVDAIIESSYANGGDLRIEIAAGRPRSPNYAWVRVVPPDRERRMCGGTCSHIVFTRSREGEHVSLSLSEAGAWGRQIWSAYADSALPGGEAMSESLSLIVRAPESMYSPIHAMLPPVLERLGLSQIVSVTSEGGPSVLLSLPDLDERWEPKASDLTEDKLEDWLLNAYWGQRGCC